MASRPFRIALAQINTTVGDLTGNCRLICEYIDRAKAVDADLVAFPEMCLTGYPPEDLLLRPHFISDSKAALKTLEAHASGITVVVGGVLGKGDAVYNAAFVLHREKAAGVYLKQRLPNYGVFDEQRYFRPGTDNRIWQIGDVKIGVSICEDIWVPYGPHFEQAQEGAGIILNISSSPYHAQKHIERQEMLQERARSTGSYVCYANLVGGQDELIFDGGSMILRPDGDVMAVGRQFEEDLVIADLDLDAVTDVQLNHQQKRAFERRRKKRKKLFEKQYGCQLVDGPELNSVSVKQLEPYEPAPKQAMLEPHMAPNLAKWEEVYEALCLGLRDYVRKNGFKKVTIGLSGGIDSTLTATIAVDALGKENVIGVTMPSRYTSHGTLTDSERTAKNLDIRLITLPIENIFVKYLDDLAGEFEGIEPGTAEENLQARIRGNLLMALSNKFGWLVVTTGNKSEMSVGYATLYGDMAGGFALLKDVPKLWVYELSRHRNFKAGTDYIPQSVIDRVPSAELRENQSDQDSLPPYEILDPILDAYIEKDKSRPEIVSMGFEPETVDKVTRMVDRNEYKRRQAPPGLKITPKAFGRDRRMPITNKYT